MNVSKPMRTCICCKAQKEKKELIRIVNDGGEISLDLTGKKNGRGAYVCNKKECIEKLKKTKALNRAFKINVSDDVYDRISEEFLGKN